MYAEEAETPLIPNFEDGYFEMPPPWGDVYMNVTNITSTLMDPAWIQEYVVSNALQKKTESTADYNENIVTTLAGMMNAPIYNSLRYNVITLKKQLTDLVNSKEFDLDLKTETKERRQMLELRSDMFDYLVDGDWKMKHVPQNQVYSIKFGKKRELPLMFFLVSVTSRGNLRLIGWVRSLFHYFLHKIMGVEPLPRRIGMVALSYLLSKMIPKPPGFLFLSYLEGAPPLTELALKSMNLDEYPYNVPHQMIKEANGEKLVLRVHNKLLDFYKNAPYSIGECAQCGLENAPYYAILWKHEEMPFCGHLCLKEFLRKNESS